MMSKERSKQILGLFAILIMFHHLGQKVSASWVPAVVRKPGLEIFVPIGYLLVSFFFFCSGYGLIKSMRTKEDYFKGFLVKRLNRILLIFIITEIVYLIVRLMNSAFELPLNPYSWFVYTIVILYIGFFLVYRKESKSSFVLMGVWILGYSIICYILIKGNWWINSAPVFLLAIYMAEQEPKGNVLTTIILPAIVFVITFVISENIAFFYKLSGLSDYGIINILSIILQIIACSCFSLVVYRLAYGGIFVKKNIVLSFFGSMTLEFYLIHGLFVQVFGHHFMNDSNPPLCYISNVFLYVLVVFALSTISAFVLKKMGDVISAFYMKSEMFKRFCKDQKRNCIIVLIILLVVTVIVSVNSHQNSEDAKKKLESYDKEELTHVNVNGTDIALYNAGDGPYTVVLLGSDTDPCPTLYLRPVANLLTDQYRVVIIDYPGKGFSGEADEERTTEYFAELVHLTLTELGVTENIILAPNQLSALYTYRLIQKYPDGVAGFVGIDAVMPEIATHFLEGNYSSVDEYRWYMRRATRLQKIEQTLLTLTGYVRIQTPIYEYLFYGSGLKEYYPVMEEMHIRRFNQSAHLMELQSVYDNCMAVDGFKLPENLPAEFVLDNYLKSTNYFGVEWINQYKKMISNKDLQTVEIVTGDPYVVYYNPDIIAKKVEDLIERIQN